MNNVMRFTVSMSLGLKNFNEEKIQKKTIYIDIKDDVRSAVKRGLLSRVVCWKDVTQSLKMHSFCSTASETSEQQHSQDLRRIYRRGYEFSNSSLFTRMHCV